MSASATVGNLKRKLPFGIGTVVGVLVVAMVMCVGAILAIGTPTSSPAVYSNGQLRSYAGEPEIAWTASDETLPNFGDGAVTIADTSSDRWLLAYPSGLGRAFVMVSRQSGNAIWHSPIVVGLGACAFSETGTVGCAIKLGDKPDGFYTVDDEGNPTRTGELLDTAQVVGIGNNYLRIDQAGYRVTLATPEGKERWTRTFAAAASGRLIDGVLIVSTADGNEFVVNSRTGEDQITCSQCKVVAFPTGIAVQYNTDPQRVVTYRTDSGTVHTQPVAEQQGLRLVEGASTLPVLTAGQGAFQETQGRYEVRDPALPNALWQITDPELSKANTRPCGEFVALALKDRSRVIYRLDDGEKVGTLAEPSAETPDANIDQLRCIGSSGTTMVFANPNQITAFDAATGETAWSYPVVGQALSVDGFIVLQQGTSLSALRPN